MNREPLFKKEDTETPLTKLYDDLKNGNPTPMPSNNMIKVTGVNGMPLPATNPNMVAWKHKLHHACHDLKNKCAKHIILDIYCKILPLDDDFKCGHMGMMKQDIDNMLANKGMTADQYLTSAYESTHAPLLDYLLRSVDSIVTNFKEDAEAELADAQEKDKEVPAPEAPDTEDQDVQNQLVDTKNDDEYETFVDELKKKTVNKIVDDVTNIINKSKEENDMEFKPTPTASINDQQLAAESTVSIALNYIEGKYLKENTEISDDKQDEFIGYAIREATMNVLDNVFKFPHSDIKSYASNIRFNKGYIVNSNIFDESVKDHVKEYKKDFLDGLSLDEAADKLIEENGWTKKDIPEVKQMIEGLKDTVDKHKAYMNYAKNDADKKRYQAVSKVMSSSGHALYKKVIEKLNEQK